MISQLKHKIASRSISPHEPNASSRLEKIEKEEISIIYERGNIRRKDKREEIEEESEEEEEEEKEKEKEKEKKEEKEKEEEGESECEEKENEEGENEMCLKKKKKKIDIKKKTEYSKKKNNATKKIKGQSKNSDILNKLLLTERKTTCHIKIETTHESMLNESNKGSKLKLGFPFLETNRSHEYNVLQDTVKKNDYKKKKKSYKMPKNDKMNLKKESSKISAKYLKGKLSLDNADLGDIGGNDNKEKDRMRKREESGIIESFTEHIDIHENYRYSDKNTKGKNIFTKDDDSKSDLYNKKNNYSDTNTTTTINNNNNNITDMKSSGQENNSYDTRYCEKKLNNSLFNHVNDIENALVESSNNLIELHDSKCENRKKEQNKQKENKIPAYNDSSKKWNLEAAKEHHINSVYNEKVHHFYDSDTYEKETRDNVYTLTDVNINDICNSESSTTKKNFDDSEQIYNSSVDKYKNTNVKYFLYNFFKSSKKGKIKKRKIGVRKTNPARKYNFHFSSVKEKAKIPQANKFLYEDSCIVFEQNEETSRKQRSKWNKKLKYKAIKNRDSVNITQDEKKRKGGEAIKKGKNKIPMNLFKHIQSNEDVKKWKNKLRLIQKLAEDEKKKTKVHVLVFVIFLFLNIFINYDSGILPVSLNKITEDLKLSVTLQGLIGAMPYVGLTLASFFLGILLQKYEQKKIIAKSMLLNIINILLTFFCTNKYLFLFLRFIYGITHSVLIIYIPVWADEYAPSLNLTFWLGLIHISTIVGITIGYFSTGLLIYLEITWMYSLLIQAFFLFFFSLILLGIPKKFINISNISKNQNISTTSKYTIFDKSMCNEISDIEEGTHHKNSDTIYPAYPTYPTLTSASTSDTWDNNTIIIYISNEADNMENLDDFNDIADKQTCKIVSELRMEADIFENQKMGYFHNIIYKARKTYIVSSLTAILRCPLYMWLVCSLCNLFFVVIGIFFWSTKFFTNYLNIGPLEAMTYFIGTSLTAPVIGILLGSKVVDKLIGGYKEYESRLKTLYFCIFNSFVTFIMALMVCLFDNYKFTLFFTWAILLFGAMLLPPITGIIISTMKLETRSFASAFSMFMYNIFGYALGTFFPGFIVDFFNVSERISIKVVYLWSFFGFFNLCIATFFAKRKKYY